MRSFLFISCCLIIVITSISCGKKSTVDDGLEGSWKLAAISFGGPDEPGSPRVGFEVLTFRDDHFYTMKYKDTVIASGTYHIDRQKDPFQSILYFGPENRPENRYTFRFNSDTLVITYSGGYILNISKYVKM
jgi:uncharacterized protein (TIGR03067 family)